MKTININSIWKKELYNFLYPVFFKPAYRGSV